MATRVPNPISFYYTSNESLLNKLSGSIKHVFVYTRTHLTRSDESRVSLWWYQGRVIRVLGGHFVSRDFFIYHLNRMHVTSKMASSRS